VKENAGVSIVLTSSQLAQVVRETSHERKGVISLLPTLNDLRCAAEVVDAHAGAGKVSRSVLRALLVLAAFPLDGTYRPLIDVSKEVGYNPSTAHRYASTWLAIGLLEQDPKSRKYRRATSSPTSTPSPQGAKKRSAARKGGRGT
jgi:IclR helix-turn-helix domain